jgi:hypothetical protein
MTLPLTVAEITPQWLSGALSAQCPGVQVTGITLDNASSGTTGRALLVPEYAEGVQGPPRLFVKLPPDDEQQRVFVTENGMGRREALFYRVLSAEVPVRVPRCYFADSNEAGDRYIMLLENLDDAGCSFRNSSSRYSMAYIREVLAAFARLHGMFWDSTRFAEELAWVEPPGFHPMAPRLVERAMEQYADSMPPVFRAMGDFYLENAAGIHQLWTEGTPTLVHGDVHDGNLFYDERVSEPGFLDWAIVGRTSCMRDVAYFMTGSLKPEDRSRHQADLLEYYYQELSRHTSASVDTDSLWTQYQWHAAYVWLAAVTTLAMGSEWQPVNYVMRTMERLNRAIEDCDSRASLQRFLS